MFFIERLWGSNPIPSSTASSKASSHLDQAMNNMQLPTPTVAFSGLQPAATQLDNPTSIFNWWQPPSNSSDIADDEDVIMEDWDDCNVPDLEYDAMSTSFFGDDGDWDSTEMLPPFTPMNVDSDTPVNGGDNTPDTTIPDTPGYQLGFWGIAIADYVMVDSEDMLQTSSAFLANTTMPSIDSSPYTHGRPVLHALDEDSEMDDAGDMLMRPTQSEIFY
ncbi:hypothetical protein PG996_014455 [Apiospora saccharicola]|uniref:Uncharacterized protein n=1 Tax=Apiospora saccharicola TaxID=335842 RepID=A0ABR1TID7_9PEZI